MKKALVYIYIIWLAVNIAVLAYAMGNPHISYHNGWVGGNFGRPSPKDGIDTSAFYPFESYDIGNYDFSEFVVYTIAVPLCLFGVVKLILLFIPQKSPK